MFSECFPLPFPPFTALPLVLRGLLKGQGGPRDQSHGRSVGKLALCLAYQKGRRHRLRGVADQVPSAAKATKIM
jgi:hypothetical protein